ncbi:N-acetylmuramoyl-L-alanine amidase [Streptomyces sp. RB6PN25]|uniref:N-acetylmuramoyl-L-alanine amidase n=1 Tax=Streptomyces humicola TaxID=2953240 RepID=A0ABT1PYV1_9ACTN|nr:N-acetylmuramoyl-L-alanine amidase [Streptomyces humicola]MCQ4082298.1 N-acetylmuramoyl-L-alanine amidase [Streptomyces humicola]
MAQAGQSGGPQPYALQDEFGAAAQEYHVPESVLLGVAYMESRWDTHNGQPSATGNYNVMGLTQVDPTQVEHPSVSDRMTELNMRGDDRRGHFHPDARVLADVGAVQTNTPALHTLDAAAKLTGQSASALRGDMKQSLRGGAALLAQYEQQATGGLPTDPAQWYPAVERFSQSPDAAGAAQFAQRVYAHIQQGISRLTADGQAVTLPAQPSLRPQTTTASYSPMSYTTTATATATATASPTPTPTATPTATASPTPTPPPTPTATASPTPTASPSPTPTPTPTPECPSGLACNFVPAAYAQDSSSLSDYGNYDIANRPADGDAIKYIVIHDTEASYSTTINQFQDPTAYASANYVIRSSDGLVTQMVPNKDIAWHAGNKYINMHAIGVEHEGYALQGATWYTESEYESSATLVKWLAAKYNIPLDREHIIGHDNVPGPLDAYVAGMHWDPGPFWDWNHYMQLLGAPSNSNPVGDPLQAGELIQIAPPFTTANEPPVDSTSAQPANFVYLRTGPSSSDPLISDPYLHSSGSGTTAGPDWGDKAEAGQQFVVAAQQGDWTAIWYGGQEVWFDNPGGTFTTPVSDTTQTLITPKDGATSIAVYGRAYPEASAYPSTITAQPVSPLSKYTVPAGQLYLAQPAETSDFYNSVNIDGSAPGDRTLVTGTTTYYPIQYDDRLAYVNTADVKVVNPVAPSASGNTIQPGQFLIPGHSLSSASMTLTMQTDGNLVGYLKTGGSGNGLAVWASNTNGHSGAYAYMQSDGNLVVYKPGGGPSTGGALWSTNTWGHSGAYATLQDDGNLVVYGSGGGPSTGGALWATNVYDHPQTIGSGQKLTPGWWTQAKYTRLVMQLDGNFVMYRNSDGKPIWSSSTYGHGGAYAYMQTDGNLVVYKPGGGPSTGGALWSTNTWGHSGAYATLQDDGNLVVYGSGGGPTVTGSTLWTSNTSSQVP